MNAVCDECGRVFDLYDENDADEWYSGHDCEDDEPCEGCPRTSRGCCMGAEFPY